MSASFILSLADTNVSPAALPVTGSTGAALGETQALFGALVDAATLPMGEAAPTSPSLLAESAVNIPMDAGVGAEAQFLSLDATLPVIAEAILPTQVEATLETPLSVTPEAATLAEARPTAEVSEPLPATELIESTVPEASALDAELASRPEGAPAETDAIEATRSDATPPVLSTASAPLTVQMVAQAQDQTAIQPEEDDAAIGSDTSVSAEAAPITRGTPAEHLAAQRKAPAQPLMDAIRTERDASTPAQNASISQPAQPSDNTAEPQETSLPTALLTQTLSPVASRPIGSPYPPASIAQPAPIVQAQPGRIGHDIGVEIAKAINGDREDLLIRLEPREMGRIDVRLSFERDGLLRAVMSAENPAALEMLRRDSSDLSRALGDAGVRSDGESLRFDSGGRDHQGQGRRHWQDDRSSSAQLGEGGISEQTIPQYRALRSSGQIDLLA